MARRRLVSWLLIRGSRIDDGVGHGRAAIVGPCRRRWWISGGSPRLGGERRDRSVTSGQGIAPAELRVYLYSPLREPTGSTEAGTAHDSRDGSAGRAGTDETQTDGTGGPTSRLLWVGLVTENRPDLGE